MAFASHSLFWVTKQIAGELTFPCKPDQADDHNPKQGPSTRLAFPTGEMHPTDSETPRVGPASAGYEPVSKLSFRLESVPGTYS